MEMNKDTENSYKESIPEKDLEECLRFTKEVLQILECPVCYSTENNLVLCSTGHHICEPCMKNIGDCCPVCTNCYIGTKLFIANDIYRLLNSLKVTLRRLQEGQDNVTVEKCEETTNQSLLQADELHKDEIKTDSETEELHY